MKAQDLQKLAGPIMDHKARMVTDSAMFRALDPWLHGVNLSHLSDGFDNTDRPASPIVGYYHYDQAVIAEHYALERFRTLWHTAQKEPRRHPGAPLSQAARAAEEWEARRLLAEAVRECYMPGGKVRRAEQLLQCSREKWDAVQVSEDYWTCTKCGELQIGAIYGTNQAGEPVCYECW